MDYYPVWEVEGKIATIRLNSCHQYFPGLPVNYANKLHLQKLFWELQMQYIK